MENKNKIDVGIQVLLKTPDSFSIIVETLSRIGIQSKKSNTLYQSCHLLHRKGDYFIVQFKELFKLDGKQTDITDEDLRRRNSIAKMLDKWKLCEIVNDADIELLSDLGDIKIVPYKEKKNWTLIQKYTIGRK
jgi:hypothetical protein